MSAVEGKKTWTARVRERAVAALPPEKLLPDGQPTYMSSWIYMFGVLSLASLAVLIGSGTILALKGPGWWHTSGLGHFFNSLHLWSVELFFFFMVIHLWGKYWMAAWRGGRKRVWVTGAITFVVAIPCALTGYVSQQNFDAQWISTQAKDAMNAAGIGAFFNLMNFGQMYSYHIYILPVAVVILVVGHVLLVRKHGIVPPFSLEGRGVVIAAAATPLDQPAREVEAQQSPEPAGAPGAAAAPPDAQSAADGHPEASTTDGQPETTPNIEESR
jgi:ubiquinol-cytochrome c reductase cytochrome b subunit